MHFNQKYINPVANENIEREKIKIHIKQLGDSKTLRKGWQLCNKLRSPSLYWHQKY